MEKDSAPVLQALPLSDNSIKRRSNETGASVEKEVCEILQKAPFILQQDETAASDNTVNALLACVRFFVDSKIMEELLLCKCLETDTLGEKVFQTSLARLY